MGVDIQLVVREFLCAVFAIAIYAAFLDALEGGGLKNLRYIYISYHVQVSLKILEFLIWRHNIMIYRKYFADLWLYGRALFPTSSTIPIVRRPPDGSSRHPHSPPLTNSLLPLPALLVLLDTHLLYPNVGSVRSASSSIQANAVSGLY